jgi:hypothetical protein
MKASQLGSLSIACVLALLAAEAKAITVPDSGSCNVDARCFSINNFSNGSASVSISGDNGAGIGVQGNASTGKAVFGNSTSSGIGVWGQSSTGNGVVGLNTRTDWGAAAISAIPGNSNGLAIWAGGGAQKPGGGSWSATSDARVKKDVKAFHPGLEELKRLRPVTYKYNGLGGTQDDGNEFVGVIAQELEKVLPSMVKSSKAKLHGKETDLKRVDPSAFTYVLINAVQEQQRIIERQEARIAKLERGDAPSGLPASLAGLALGLVPLGLIVAWRRRKEWSSGQA